MIEPGEKVVVLLTGSGLKDLASVQSLIEIPKPIKSLDELTIKSIK